MWETIRGYLTFTRKERTGVLSLLIVISLLFILPFFFRPFPGDPDPAAFDKMKEAIGKLESRAVDSSDRSVVHDRYHGRGNSVAEFKKESDGEHVAVEMFYFDPNGISAGDWKRLGLPERVVQTILHYIKRGGRFRNGEDLQKVYGLHPADYKRLLPFVRIGKPPENHHPRSKYIRNEPYPIDTINNSDPPHRTDVINPNYRFPKKQKRFDFTDINDADSAAWSGFPGIGEKLASRIVHFRVKLGGFYQIDQVHETFGLPDSTFQKIKPYLQMKSSSVNKMDLNSVTRETLQGHPYIRWQLAKIITDYRQQHGGFQSVDELLQLARIDRVTFDRLKPYLMVKR